jgi:LytS/YehU family sensor histidine kinase
MKAPIYFLYSLNAVSVFTSWIFVIQPDGTFQEGPLFVLKEAIPLLYLFAAFGHLIVEIVSRRARNKKYEYCLYLFFIIFSIVGVYLGDYLPILPVGELSILVMIEVMFFTLYQDQERKLSEYRTAIVVSQIKPHFIFNVLTAIQVLCKEKAPEAAKLLEQFSDYLRLNIDALDKTEPIPFEEELKHTQNYLAIEKTRFGERLNVAYDIQTTQFKIPALSLQPIVENAVKYGLMKKVEGVTVKISTKKEDANFIVSVADDGVGFDPTATKNDGREHVGLKNSEERIQTMCGGKLLIHSEIGKGTTVQIVIPEEAKN